MILCRRKYTESKDSNEIDCGLNSRQKSVNGCNQGRNANQKVEPATSDQGSVMVRYIFSKKEALLLANMKRQIKSIE